MSNNFLDKFRSSLPTTQGNQILKLLITKKDSGEIKTIDEFKTRLTELTSKILADRITPTLSVHYAILGQDISSELYNDMLERIQDDLEAGFKEADNIDEILEAHHNLIQHISLKALRYGINELESKITLYEFIHKNMHGLEEAMFNTFRESNNNITPRTEEGAGLLFVDPQARESISSNEDAFIDLLGERLILGPSTTTYPIIKQAIWLSNSNSIRSELEVSFRNSKISNILDNKKNTYWVESILLSAIRIGGVPMEVALYMASVQDVNYIEIEPASDFPMYLVGIDYYDANNIRQSTEVAAIQLDGPTRINFTHILTSALIIRVRQDNYKEIQFNKKAGESNFHRALLNESSSTIDIDSISEDLREVLSSEFILSDIMGIGSQDINQVKYYEYILGFDNVATGFSLYDERSIFVSNKKSFGAPGTIALKALETRPQQIEGSSAIEIVTHSYPARTLVENTKFYHGSLEYYAIIQSYSSDNYLLGTDIIPVLPIGAARVYHERLVFIKKSTGVQNADLAQLRFYTAANGNDVALHRNGTRITYSVDWEFITSGDSSGLTVETSGAGKPMTRGIHVLATVKPLDIYTVSYTPEVSSAHIDPSDNTLLKIVDVIGDKSARSTQDNIIMFSDTKSAYTVSRADVYLLIILRRNSSNESFSPAVEEYMLAIGSRNGDKFLGD